MRSSGPPDQRRQTSRRSLPERKPAASTTSMATSKCSPTRNGWRASVPNGTCTVAGGVSECRAGVNSADVGIGGCANEANPGGRPAHRRLGRHVANPARTARRPAAQRPQLNLLPARHVLSTFWWADFRVLPVTTWGVPTRLPEDDPDRAQQWQRRCALVGSMKAAWSLEK